MKRFFHRIWAHIVMSNEMAKDIQDHLVSGAGTAEEKSMRLQRIGKSKWLKHPKALYWSHPGVREK
jgi:hypothetical protein